MPTSTILTLSDEILYYILGIESIDWKDISRMALTCKSMKKRLLDTYVGVLQFNKRYRARAQKRLKYSKESKRAPFLIPNTLYAILPSFYAILDYYKGCNLLPLFESAIQIFDLTGIGMKDMMIPAVILMAEHKANENDSEASLLLLWAEEQFPGTRYHNGVIEMSSLTAYRISQVLSSRPIDWGPGWKYIEPVVVWYQRKRGMISVS